MSKSFDLTLLPLYRLGGNELPSPPGLLALTPPRKKARSRARDLLVIHLVLGGNAPFSTVNYLQMTSHAAEEFYQTPGSVTSALRAAATTLNGDLLERNMAASGQGRYSLANLVLGAIRGEQLYVLEAGSTHVYWMSEDERKDIHAPDMSGRGLGLGQSTDFYLSQLTLRSGGRLLISPELPDGWTQILQRDNSLASLDTLRSVLMRQSMDDRNAVLVEVQSGPGNIEILKPARIEKPTLESISRKIAEEPVVASVEDDLSQEKIEQEEESVENIARDTSEDELETEEESFVPEIYAESVKSKEEKNDFVPEIASHRAEPQPIVPPVVEDDPVAAATFDSVSKPPQERAAAVEHDTFVIPDSIPRQRPEPIPAPAEIDVEIEEEIKEKRRERKREKKVRTGPPVSEIIARKGAHTIAKGMQVTRAGNNRLKDLFATMLPRLLPSSDSETPIHLPTWVMALIAFIIPVVIATIGSVVYSQFGGNLEYERYYTEAETLRARALVQDDPVAKRIAWEDVVLKLNEAEKHDTTANSRALREEAQRQLDDLLGIIRLNFLPIINALPKDINITAMVATDTELFMLDSGKGEILRAFRIDKGYQFDASFICRGGDYGEHTLDALVELQALPTANALGASVLGIDRKGNLLYCAANRVPQATALLPPTVGFKEITAIALDSGVLYILDAASNEIWTYSGQATSFNNYPTAFFENAPEGMGFAQDISISGSDLFILFGDGHLASCTSSLLNTVPTRCINPAPLNDPHPAAGGSNSFDAVTFKEIYLSTPPDSALLLMAPDNQSVFRFSPRAFALQNQLHPLAKSIPAGALTAMTQNPSHVLFVAQGNEVYMADAP
ncbi:MAG: hypothetical protein HN390_11080 [Anaerolineae bacterium]|nr:hypothetical protein [Anaerolineae bacterium]MBT7191949.1 hypothetical protein [Anaerolineae bacterium]MBT7988608.1 hypothetical protein [Anaerolineae bacterium]